MAMDRALRSGIGGAACLALMAVATQARAMDFTLMPLNDGQVIRAAGEIVDKDDEKLHKFVSEMPPETKLIAFIMTSPGGNLREGVRLAETIRSSELETGVVDQCASACFLMFAAGRVKYVIDDAAIGVHSASMPGGRETTESQAITTLMARTASEYGVPSGIIGKMVTTPPTNLTWLTAEELKSMNARKIYTRGGTYRPGTPLRPGSAATAAATPAPTLPAAKPPDSAGTDDAAPPEPAAPAHRPMVGRIRPRN